MARKFKQQKLQQPDKVVPLKIGKCPNCAKPAAAKGQYVRKLTLSSAMGPGVKIDRTELVP